MSILPPDFDVTKGEDICGDGSVLKVLQTEGSGEKPKMGSKVTVHYTGVLTDGSKFDSSVDRNDPFKFTLGSGVIQGWSDGVATMKPGEGALFIIRADKGYGANGSPPKIPGGATLVFKIDLISWTDLEDVSDNRDGKVMKRVLAEGVNWDRPEMLSKVTMHLELFNLDEGEKEFFSTRSGNPMQATIDENEISVGVEMLLKNMKKSEKAEAIISADLANSGPQAVKNKIKARVELISFEKEKNPWDMDKTEDKLAAYDAKKACGTNYFKAKDFARAYRRYEKALGFLEPDRKTTDEEKKDFEEKKAVIYGNMAACLLKTKEFRKAIEYCDKTLAIDANNEKALYRRATANFDVGEWELSLGDAKRVLEINAGNSAATKLMAKISAKKKKQNEEEKKKFKGMFG